MHTSRRKRGGNEEIERGLSHTRTFVKCIHTRAGITNFLNTTRVVKQINNPVLYSLEYYDSYSSSQRSAVVCFVSGRCC